ncbi:MAG: thioredoxin domain-containing protein [Gemmatimonas sp.]
MNSSLRILSLGVALVRRDRVCGEFRGALAVVGIGLVMALSACGGKTAGAETSDGKVGGSTLAAASLTASTNATANATAGADTLTDAALVTRADAGRLMGRDSGAMWLIMISDFQCPYCKQWHDSTHAAVKHDYVDKGLVRLGYMNLPLPQHIHARNEAEAALCAGAQGKFWPFADVLFREQPAIGRMTTIEPLLDSLGKALALDMSAFARCRKSPSIRALVDSDIQQALRAKVNSTPSFLVGDFLVQGVSPYESFRKAIDTALVLHRNKAKRTR